MVLFHLLLAPWSSTRGFSFLSNAFDVAVLLLLSTTSSLFSHSLVPKAYHVTASWKINLQLNYYDSCLSNIVFYLICPLESSSPMPSTECTMNYYYEPYSSARITVTVNGGTCIAYINLKYCFVDCSILLSLLFLLVIILCPNYTTEFTLP